MERFCTVLAATAVFLCGVITVAISVLYFRHVQNSGACDVCLTKGCVTAAHDVLSKMDLNIDPCDNFYEFSCGNFLKETTIPDEKTSVTMLGKIGDHLTGQLRSILEEPPHHTEARSYAMAKTLYKACMDKASIEEIGLTRIKQLLSRMGGWPVLEGDAWQEAKFTWQDTIYKFREEGFGINYMFSLFVSSDWKNGSRRVIAIDQAVLSISREYLIKGMEEKQVSALYSYMVDIARIFGADRERAVNELRESLQFEIQLAEISLPPVERRDANKIYNLMTVGDLQEKYPTIPWMEYMERIMGEEVGGIHLDDTVNVGDLECLRKIGVLLSKTPKRVLANYLLWRAIASVDQFLNEEVLERQLEYSAAISGQSERPPRWEECVGDAGRLMLAVGSLYVKRLFREEAKANALEMFENIRAQMYDILETVDWMDEKTRKNALEKARAMTSYIGYPEELLDEDKVNRHYEKLNVDENSNNTNLLDMNLNVNKFVLEGSFRKLRERVNKNDWRKHGDTAVANAVYYFGVNSIEIPAGILQGAFFSHDQPNYMNYGAIGVVIGHEITHGFDDKGRQFDEEGNLFDWWEPETKEAYLNKTQCIIHQYGNYTVDQVGMKLNGVNTQGENIADNGGTKQAYHAYKKWARQHGEEKRLPGLERFTPQQMFWISAASKECTKLRLEVLKDRIVTDVHSPGEFRVRGSFSNRAEFAKDFNCPEGSPMNPSNKCQVW